MKTYILCCLLGAMTLSGCLWGHIERNLVLSEKNALSLAGKEATVTLKDSTVYEATILAFRDSVLVSDDSANRNVPLTDVRDILVEGSFWGRWGGGVVGGVLGGFIAKPRGGNVLGSGSDGGLDPVGGALVGASIGGFLGDLLITPTRRYIINETESDLPADSSIQQTKAREETNARYVLVVEKFLEETESTLTIPWQGKAVTLPKSEISIEKHEKGYRITVPARLLQ